MYSRMVGMMIIILIFIIIKVLGDDVVCCVVMILGMILGKKLYVSLRKFNLKISIILKKGYCILVLFIVGMCLR